MNILLGYQILTNASKMVVSIINYAKFFRNMESALINLWLHLMFDLLLGCSCSFIIPAYSGSFDESCMFHTMCPRLVLLLVLYFKLHFILST